jgi:hypothetical protein
MNIADRKKKLEKAKGFIGGGKAVAGEPKKTSKPDRKKSSANKAYATYYLPKSLIKKVRQEAVNETESGRPSHVVEQILETYFDNKNI